MPDFDFRYLLQGALAIALVIAAFTDLRRRQIDNTLNAAIALVAPLYWWAAGYSLWPDVVYQIGLAVAVFAVFAALFAMRWMGGGDVKLLTALALWIAPYSFAQLLIVMALVGLLLTIVFGAWHIARRQRDRVAIPYGVAIAVAGLWVLVSQYSNVIAVSQLPTGLQ
ncbi:prepilin peptidase [Novosphingobium sp.]|uniref:A24 family peptidase n=1 Tax=Novosphingobium sp. TaxID=1874826 RepID=UPI0025D048FD|nr:prepilin peptidase [Novosphingobium sp.]